MTKTLKLLVLTILLSCFFSLGWVLAPRPIESEVRVVRDTIVIIDTLPSATISERPEQEIRARLPTIAPPIEERGDDPSENIAPQPDSTMVRIPIRRYTFDKPGVYHIEALGYNVTLPKVEVYKTSTEIVTTQYKHPKWEVNVEAGFNNHNQWIGLGVDRSIGRIKVSAFAGYDPHLSKHLVGARIRLTLFRK